MKNQIIRITCTTDVRDQMCFYAETRSERIFLFHTDYYDSRIAGLYRTGMFLDALVGTRYSKRLGKNPFGGVRFQKIRDHILRVLRYYEKESDTPIFRQTQRHRYEKYCSAA